MVLSYSGCLCRVGFDRRVARVEGQNTKPLFLIQKKEIRKQEVGASVACLRRTQQDVMAPGKPDFVRKKRDLGKRYGEKLARKRLFVRG